jgi:hypothetical protein
MYQSVLYFDHWVDEDFLWKNCPPEEKGNYDYLVEIVDWELNVDPDFRKNRFMRPIAIRPEETEPQGYVEEWICYKSDKVSAKRLRVLPGQSVIVRDRAAYGIICLQGHGLFGGHKLETPALIRFGQLTGDEFFVSEKAAREGVTVQNLSAVEDIVILKHFAGNPGGRS